MIFANSATEPGQPCVMTSGNGFGPTPRAWMKWMPRSPTRALELREARSAPLRPRASRSARASRRRARAGTRGRCRRSSPSRRSRRESACARGARADRSSTASGTAMRKGSTLHARRFYASAKAAGNPSAHPRDDGFALVSPRRASVGSSASSTDSFNRMGEVVMNRTVLSFALVAALVGGFTADGRAGETGQCIKAAAATTRSARPAARKTSRPRRTPASTRTTSASRRVARCAPTVATPPASTTRSRRATPRGRRRSPTASRSIRRDPATRDHLHRQRAGRRLRVPAGRAQEHEVRAERVPQGFKSLRGRLPAGRRHRSTIRSSAGTTRRPSTRRCRGDCREDFQVDKDACRNLDHDCVENCRADRNDCNEPVQDQLDADVAACRATAAGRHRCLQRRPDVHRAGARRGLPVPRSGA